jgi:PTS system nitrogen regulatory IIA component
MLARVQDARCAMHGTPGPTMNVSEMLTEELVLPTLDARDKEMVMLSLARRLAGVHRDVDGQRLVEALRERERQVSTALVDGVAVPHARLSGVERIVGVLGRSASGIACDSHDGRPTHLFFLLVSPAEEPGHHLRALATVSRLLHDPHCRSGLMAAADAPAMLAVLHAHASRHHRAA